MTKEDTVKDFQKKCTDCGHTKANHYALPNRDDHNPMLAGRCNRDGCECNKFKK